MISEGCYAVYPKRFLFDITCAQSEINKRDYYAGSDGQSIGNELVSDESDMEKK